MAAVGAPDPGKAPGEHATPMEALQGAGDDGPEEAVSRGIAVVVYIKEGVSVVRDMLPEPGALGPARTINGQPSSEALGSGDSRGKTARVQGIGGPLP